MYIIYNIIITIQVALCTVYISLLKDHFLMLAQLFGSGTACFKDSKSKSKSKILILALLSRPLCVVLV